MTTILRFLRMASYVVGIYFLFRIGFPDEPPTLAYHALTLPILLGGALGVCIMLKVVSFASDAAAWGVEAAFAVGVLLYVGYTLPQVKGQPPLTQLVEGYRPTQSVARDGAAKLGLDPNRGVGKAIVSIFPKN